MTTCSAGSALVGEQLIGSAPTASTWLALEQNGPWGARAFTHSHLDPAVGKALEDAATTAGVRPCLVRRPGRHADPGTGTGAPRTVLVAHTVPGQGWLVAGTVADPARLLGLDLPALAGGDPTSALAVLDGATTVDEPHLLVCTNGTRDVCCATLGRPVAQAALADHPGRVWESTHTSGHRFAATSVLLPSGALHGRLDGAGAAAVLDEAGAGRLRLEGYRGRSTWRSPGQVAELAVREATGEVALDALSVVPLRGEEPDRHAAVVSHVDGRRWQVEVHRVPTGVDRPESCGKSPAPLFTFHVATLTPLL